MNVRWKSFRPPRTALDAELFTKTIYFFSCSKANTRLASQLPGRQSGEHNISRQLQYSLVLHVSYNSCRLPQTWGLTTNLWTVLFTENYYRTQTNTHMCKWKEIGKWHHRGERNETRIGFIELIVEGIYKVDLFLYPPPYRGGYIILIFLIRIKFQADLAMSVCMSDCLSVCLSKLSYSSNQLRKKAVRK